MGYVESFNELAEWRDALNSTSEPHEIIRAIEERITSERDRERRDILLHLLHETYLAQGRSDAAAAIRGLDPVDQLHRWHEQWRRNTPDVDIVPALEERVRSEADPARLHALRFHLASELEMRGDYAAAEAVILADIAANPDEPLPLISLARQKLYQESNPDAASPIIDRAVEVAMRTGIFRRHALATKARVALARGDHAAVEDVLRQIMRLTFTRGNIDIGVERDIFDRLPAGSIDPEVARAYDDFCRAHGKTRTKQQTYLDELILQLARSKWQKVARIVAQVLDECERQSVAVDATAVEGSIRFLVEEGRLEAQGDISKWRHSEIRRTDEPAPDAGGGGGRIRPRRSSRRAASR